MRDPCGALQSRRLPGCRSCGQSCRWGGTAGRSGTLPAPAGRSGTLPAPASENPAPSPHPGRPSHRVSETPEVWAAEDDPPEDAPAAALVGRLRHALGKDTVASTPGGYRPARGLPIVAGGLREAMGYRCAETLTAALVDVGADLLARLGDLAARYGCSRPPNAGGPTASAPSRSAPGPRRSTRPPARC
ncbi:hypothetical protein ABZ357_09010 [Streptomyces sp. NPDC005917]|uniref:hypothetical protein n=1 Tax=unclassified Streptomyces TaxID=2593676 RepID=UPI0033DB4424